MIDTVTGKFYHDHFEVELEVQYDCDTYGNWDILSYKMLDVEAYPTEDSSKLYAISDSDLDCAADTIVGQWIDTLAEEGHFQSWEKERRDEHIQLVGKL